METLFDELGDVLLHAKPIAVFRQPLNGSHGITMASFLHVSTHYQPHLELLISARNPKHRAPMNLEPKEPLVIQGDLTIVRHERRSPRSDCPQAPRQDFAGLRWPRVGMASPHGRCLW